MTEATPTPAAPAHSWLRPWLVGLGTFVLAFAARLLLTSTARFGGDEIVMFQMAERISRGEEFPLLGPSITGGGANHPGPAFFYLMSVPLLCGFNSPEAANAFVALLCGIGVLLYWSALRPCFGEAGAATAAVLSACLPWSTLYGDRIWNANVIGFFIAAAFWAACRLRRQPSLRYVVLLALSAGILPQFHMSSPIVWAALLPIVWPALSRWRSSWTVAVLLCALLLYAPLGFSEGRSHGQNTRLFLAETSTNTSSDWQRLPLWVLRLFTLDVSYHQLFSYWDVHSERQMVDLVLHGNADVRWTPLRHLLLGVSYCFALFTLGFLLVRGLQRPRGPRPAESEDRTAFARAALCGFAANLLLLWATHKALFGHYLQPLLPFYFVAFAALGQAASEWRRGRLVVPALVGVLCLGGVDSATWVSSTLDGRNGLATLRAVLASIRRDRPALEKGRLEFDYRSWDWGYNVVLSFDPGNKLRFDKEGPVYKLRLREAAAPQGGRLVTKAGPVAVWAMPSP